MAKLTKKRKAIVGKIEPNKEYTLTDATKLVKEVTYIKRKKRIKESL